MAATKTAGPKPKNATKSGVKFVAFLVRDADSRAMVYVVEPEDAHLLYGHLADGKRGDKLKKTKLNFLAAVEAPKPGEMPAVSDGDAAEMANVIVDWRERRILTVDFGRPEDGEGSLFVMNGGGVADEHIPLGPPAREAGFWVSLAQDLSMAKAL